MRNLLTLLTILATASAQAVTDLIVPSSTPLPGCQNSAQGTFGLSVVNATGFDISNATNVVNGSEPTSSPAPARRSWELPIAASQRFHPRQSSGQLTLSLTGGLLTDGQNRTGYIASNYQFQFDGPPQAGAIYTAGWTICSNGSLSLGGQSVFWQCLSGEFYNLYDRNWAVHCFPIYLQTTGTGTTYSTAPPGPESTGADQNTIVNGGGTQSASASASASETGSESAAASSTDTAAASSSASDSATQLVTGTGATASLTSAVSSASAAASSSVSAAAAAATATNMPQRVLGWAAGVVGAVMLV